MSQTPEQHPVVAAVTDEAAQAQVVAFLNEMYPREDIQSYLTGSYFSGEPPAIYYLGIKKVGKFIGAATLAVRETNDGPWAVLHHIGVDPSLRRQGFGTALLKHAESVARDKGAQSLNVYPYEEQYDFFANQGYTGDAQQESWHKDLGTPDRPSEQID